MEVFVSVLTDWCSYPILRLCRPASLVCSLREWIDHEGILVLRAGVSGGPRPVYADGLRYW